MPEPPEPVEDPLEEDEPETAPADASSPPTPPEPAEDWSTRYRYLLAEFDNYRKRIEREREQWRRESRALVLRQLLGLHDAFERAEAAARDRPPEDPLRRGLEILKREWDRFLTSEGVVPVARVGELFRPTEEDAVGEVPARGVPPGYIAEVVQQGFRSPAGLLRPAKVLVAGAPAGTDTAKSAAGVAPAPAPPPEG
jgi:molecular chaperone GrpE